MGGARRSSAASHSSTAPPSGKELHAATRRSTSICPPRLCRRSGSCTRRRSGRLRAASCTRPCASAGATAMAPSPARWATSRRLRGPHGAHAELTIAQLGTHTVIGVIGDLVQHLQMTWHTHAWVFLDARGSAQALIATGDIEAAPCWPSQLGLAPESRSVPHTVRSLPSLNELVRRAKLRRFGCNVPLTARREQLASDVGMSKADLGSMLDQNFELRRGVYGDAALGATNVEMVETARAVGAAAKFCGSGGAVLVCCQGGEDQVVDLIGAHACACTSMRAPSAPGAHTCHSGQSFCLRRVTRRIAAHHRCICDVISGCNAATHSSSNPSTSRLGGTSRHSPRRTPRLDSIACEERYAGPCAVLLERGWSCAEKCEEKHFILERLDIAPPAFDNIDA